MKVHKLIKLWSKLPGIGEKTARRMVFFILKQDSSWVNEFIGTIKLGKNQERRKTGKDATKYKNVGFLHEIFFRWEYGGLLDVRLSGREQNIASFAPLRHTFGRGGAVASGNTRS